MKKIVALMTLLLAQNSYALGVNINPVQISLKNNETNASFVVNNVEKEDKAFKMSISGWTQTDNKEIVLNPDPSIVIYPPILNLKGLQEKTIRIFLKNRKYDFYKINMLEVPQTKKEHKGYGLNTILSINIPLFYVNADRTKATNFEVKKIKDNPLSQNGNDCFVVASNNSKNIDMLIKANYQEGGSDKEAKFQHSILPGFKQNILVPNALCEGKKYTLTWLDTKKGG